MAGSAGSIFVDLLLRDANYVSGLNRARNQTRSWSSQTRRDASNVSKSFQDVINPVSNIGAAFARLGGIFAGALSVQKVIQYSDSWRQLEGRLLIVEGSMEGVRDAQEGLFEVAQRTRQSLEGVTSFYSRLAQFIPEAERAQYDLLGVTESVAAALAITGETSASATGAMIQFTQAIGTNFEAAGQELRSLQEQAPRLTQALMNALGDGTKSLQQLKNEGKLTRESVLNALGGMGEEGRKLAEELEKVPLTVGQAFTRLDNAFLSFIGTSQAVTSSSQLIANAISTIAKNLDLVANAVVVLSIVLTTRLLTSLATTSVGFFSATASALSFNVALGTLAFGSRAAGIAMTGFAASARVANLAVSALGGPIGILAIGVYSVIQYFGGWQKSVDGLRAILVYFSRDLAKLTNTVFSFGIAVYEGFSESLTRASEIFSAFREGLVSFLSNPFGEGNFNKLRDELDKGFVGAFSDAFKKVMDDAEAFNRQIDIAANDEVMRIAEEVAKRESKKAPPPTFIPSTGSGISDKDAKKREKELESFYNKYEHLIKGVTRETLNYAEAEKQLYELLESGKITYEQLYTALSGLDEQYSKSTESAKVFAFDTESAVKRASENIQDAFADFLFDPFDKGLKGMLLGFVETLQRMIAEASSAKILGSLFGEGGFGSGGGILGGLFDNAGGFFDGLFANGGFIQPGHFGIVGEGGGWEHAEIVMGGRSGATVVPQNKIGQSNSYTFNVGTEVNQQDIRRLEAMVISAAGPGVIETRVSNAQKRGRL